MSEKEYIDRKAIIEKLNEIGGCDASDDFSKGWDKAIDAAIEAVEKLPAEDFALVKYGHGRWIKIGNYAFKCTSCGKTYWESKGYAARTHFCPSCGAKMDNEIRKD